MSKAEIAARKVYQEYHLDQLPGDVKRQLMILFLMNGFEMPDSDNASMPEISVEELKTRAEKSYKEAVNGEGKPLDELLDNISQKYPWL